MTWTGLLHKEGGILVMCCGTETPSLIWLKGSVDVGTMFTYLLRGWCKPAPIAQWLARQTVGRKVWGSNPIRVMWDFSALAGSYPELGVLWAQWEGWNHTAELHPLNGCVFEGVALIT